MNILKSLMIASLLFSGAQALAHGKKNGPCKMFWESCKSTKGKAAKKDCVMAAAAADPTNGPACTASMEEHKMEHKGKMHGKKPAEPATTTGTGM